MKLQLLDCSRGCQPFLYLLWSRSLRRDIPSFGAWSKMAAGGLKRDLLRWLLSLNLSYPIKNPKR